MGWSRQGCNQEGVSIPVSFSLQPHTKGHPDGGVSPSLPDPCLSTGARLQERQSAACRPPLRSGAAPPSPGLGCSSRAPLHQLGCSLWVWTGNATEGCGGRGAILWCLLTSLLLLSLAGFMYSFEMKRSILNQQYLAALRQIAVVFLTNWNTMAPFLIISSSSVLFLWFL